MTFEDPYSLPTIRLVGGDTQDLVFHLYSAVGHRPYDLTDCSCEFALLHFRNKFGEPILRKEMMIVPDTEHNLNNVVRTILPSKDTVDLFGKYIYQVSIKDIGGNTENPQGILYINNNINKDFIS